MRLMKPYFTILTPEKHITGMLQRIEAAGRTCYKSESRVTEGSAEKFVQNLITRGHESVIEHESVSVRIICDRGVSHELVRHRLASYSQESTRYCNYSGDNFRNELTFIEPCFYEEYSEEDLLWRTACQVAENIYLDLIRRGSTSQEARSVLPNSLKTEIVMTCNLREWRHFFKVRCAPGAHPQMREIAMPMLVKFKKLLPAVFWDISHGGES